MTENPGGGPRSTEDVIADDERLSAVQERIDDAREAVGGLHDADVLGDVGDVHSSGRPSDEIAGTPGEADRPDEARGDGQDDASGPEQL